MSHGSQHTAVRGLERLRDGSEIAGLLDAAGFADVAIESFSPDLLLGGGGSVDESADFLLGMGIVRGLLGRLDPQQRESAIRVVREELADRHEAGVGIRLAAGVWLVVGHLLTGCIRSARDRQVR